MRACAHACACEQSEDRELSREEEQHAAATASLEAAHGRVRAAAEELAGSRAAMATPYVAYPAYWVDGLGGSGEAVQAAADAGAPLRAAVWGRAGPPVAAPAAAPAAGAGAGADRQGTPGTPTAGGGTLRADAAAAAAAAAAAEPAPPQPPPPPSPPPELWSALRAAAGVAGWDARIGLLAAVDLELPSSPPEEAPEDAGGKAGAKGKGAAAKPPAAKGGAKGKSGAKEEEAPGEAPPPPDAPGWEALAALLGTLRARARTYDEWRRTVRVYDAPPAAPLGGGPAGGAGAGDGLDHYRALLEGVEPDRVGVPVLVHAMLEQLTRSMVSSGEVQGRGAARAAGAEAPRPGTAGAAPSDLGFSLPGPPAAAAEEAVSDAAAAEAASWSLGALGCIFDALERAEGGGVFSKEAAAAAEYTLVLDVSLDAGGGMGCLCWRAVWIS
jgi:hypothetical protein